jgi:hypothetical protein
MCRLFAQTAAWTCSTTSRGRSDAVNGALFDSGWRDVCPEVVHGLSRCLKTDKW